MGQVAHMGAASDPLAPPGRPTGRRHVPHRRRLGAPLSEACAAGGPRKNDK